MTEKQDLLDGSQAPITEVPPMSCMVSYRKLLHSGLNLTTEERISANILTFDQCDNSQFIGHRTLSQGISSTRSLQTLLPTQWAQESKQEEDRLCSEVIPISCPPLNLLLCALTNLCNEDPCIHDGFDVPQPA